MVFSCRGRRASSIAQRDCSCSGALSAWLGMLEGAQSAGMDAVSACLCLAQGQAW